MFLLLFAGHKQTDCEHAEEEGDQETADTTRSSYSRLEEKTWKEHICVLILLTLECDFFEIFCK